MLQLILQASDDVTQATQDAGAIAQFLNQYGIGLGLIAMLGGIAFMLWRKYGRGNNGTNASVLAIGLAMAWSLSGCAMFDATKLEVSATEKNAAVWREFEADSEQWWEDAKYPDSLREAYRLRFKGAIKNADAMAERAKEGTK